MKKILYSAAFLAAMGMASNANAYTQHLLEHSNRKGAWLLQLFSFGQKEIQSIEKEVTF